MDSDEIAKLVKTILNCMEEAEKECPEEAKNWTPEELWERGSDWAGRHVVISEKEGHQ